MRVWWCILRDSLVQIEQCMAFVGQAELLALLRRAVIHKIYRNERAKSRYNSIVRHKSRPEDAEIASDSLNTVVMEACEALAKLDPDYINLFAYALSVHKAVDDAIASEIERSSGLGAWQCNALIQYLKYRGHNVSDHEALYRRNSTDVGELKKLYRDLWKTFIVNALPNALTKMPADAHARGGFNAWSSQVVAESYAMTQYVNTNPAMQFSVDFLQRTLLGGDVMTHWFEIGLAYDSTDNIVDVIVGNRNAGRPPLADSITSFAVNPVTDPDTHKPVIPAPSMLDLAFTVREQGANRAGNPVGFAATSLLREMSAADEPSKLSAIRSAFVRLVSDSDYRHKGRLVRALKRSVSRDALQFVCKASLRLLHKKQGFIFRHRLLSENSDLLQQIKTNPAFAFLGNYLQNFDRSWTESFGLFKVTRAASPAADDLMNKSQQQLLEAITSKTA